MNCLVIDNFRIRTSTGIKDFTRGQIIPIDSSKAASLIEKGVIKKIEPYIDSHGDLVIPFLSAHKYHWWAGGQSIKETLQELAEGVSRVN